MKNVGQSADYAAITARQKETWAAGDFNQIARQNVCMAEALCDAVDLHAGERVLDVACGSGTAALVASRRYCDVVGIDYVAALIERARHRAVADDLDAEFHVGDAQDLPFPDASFDAVLSVYGVQFAPDQEQAANEMLRVCRPGGRIALASPIPEGWSGDFFATNAKYVPPPAGIKPPLRWGTEVGLEELLGAGTRSISSEKRTALQYYRSIEHAGDVFLRYFGPAIRASQADSGRGLRGDLEAVFDRYNRATDGTAVIENTYLLTVAIRA
ncbi:class I SAM-dependent methyltransferase [Halomonas sp. M4R5S39]|uniref:class I SAM-dependent methyltransferase n=1 Tax=Halomonas kalidii TaxID=3043293 RepID=UPI0024A8DDF8|nr:class I SAM-dependent methyltransferase [Halomonas kalidii]MDI5983776.1 class I SAM-dependent methyltransferase [Halomonas kalidii]